MRVRGSVKIGAALVVLGATAYLGVGRWMSTRTVRPVDLPISLAKGHIRTGQFRLNLNATYMVYVAPNTDWRWEQAHPDCNPYRHLQSRWVLYKDGKAVERLNEPVTLPWYSQFTAGSGVYELDVEVLSDFGCVDSAGPHLEVIADTENYEAGAFLLRAIAVMTVILGVCMLTFLQIVRRVRSREETLHLTDAASAGGNFQGARKLPLRKPISGLPGFGLIAATFFAFMAMVMMVLHQPRTPMGLWVHLIRLPTPPKNDAGTEPLIVRVKHAGVGQTPTLFVNSKQVEWEDLSRTLKEELSIRKEWVVYVGGDDEVAFANIASVIDVAKARGAKVVLITGK